MTILNHTLGFPRVGLRRELKKAQESYWAGNSTREELLAVGRELRARHWDQQKQAGIDLLPVGDFAWYDHVLTTSLLLGNVPQRHQNNDGSVDRYPVPYWSWTCTDWRTCGGSGNDQMV